LSEHSTLLGSSFRHLGISSPICYITTSLRHFQWTGDEELFDKVYGQIGALVPAVIETQDTNGDGVPEWHGGNSTHDNLVQWNLSSWLAGNWGAKRGRGSFAGAALRVLCTNDPRPLFLNHNAEVIVEPFRRKSNKTGTGSRLSPSKPGSLRHTRMPVPVLLGVLSGGSNVTRKSKLARRGFLAASSAVVAGALFGRPRAAYPITADDLPPVPYETQIPSTRN